MIDHWTLKHREAKDKIKIGTVFTHKGQKNIMDTKKIYKTTRKNGQVSNTE